MSDSPRCRTFRYLLQPTARQRVALDRLLRCQCELYNAALEERRGAWRWEKRSLSFFDQVRTLTGLRDDRPDTLAHGVVVCRGTLKRLDEAFQAFYRRCRAGQKPGYPRFRPISRFDSVQWDACNGWFLDEDRRRLHIHGLGDVKARLHRRLVGTPKAITVKREGRRWWLTVRCVDVPANPLPATGRIVGIDLGIASLWTTSGGEHLGNPRHGRRAAAKLAAAQRSLATKQRGSGRRRRAVERVAHAHSRVCNQRRDHAHQISRRLVNDHDLIVHEDLRIANMVRSPNTGLNRSIHDAGWGQLLATIAYKAEDAGRQVIAVNPRHTSQTCAECGHVSRENRVTQAAFRCTACGHKAHADVNAAINILRLGQSQRQGNAA